MTSSWFLGSGFKKNPDVHLRQFHVLLLHLNTGPKTIYTFFIIWDIRWWFISSHGKLCFKLVLCVSIWCWFVHFSSWWGTTSRAFLSDLWGNVNNSTRRQDMSNNAYILINKKVTMHIQHWLMMFINVLRKMVIRAWKYKGDAEFCRSSIIHLVHAFIGTLFINFVWSIKEALRHLLSFFSSFRSKGRSRYFLNPWWPLYR